MNAFELTRNLRGDWHGSYGLVPGPGHSMRDRSVKVMDGENGIVIHSFAGDCWRQIKAAWNLDSGFPHPSGKTSKKRGIKGRAWKSETQIPHPTGGAALSIWRASRPMGSPVADTIARIYLEKRGIIIKPPPSFRAHANLRHGPTGLEFPAMVAAVQASDRRIVAIHRTFLTPHGKKAGVSSPKMALGPLGDGSVRLAKAGPVLGLAEGIEDALSAMQLFDVPCWAALGTRLASVAIPDEVIEVQIFADNGDAGVEAAERAAQHFTSIGKRVVLRYPPEPFKDWNEALQGVCGHDGS